MEDPARSWEQQPIMAQMLANVSTFGFVDPFNPENISQTEFGIKLLDASMQPVYVKDRPMSEVEARSAYCRCRLMVQQGRLEPSNSPWNHPLHMVVNRERYDKFLLEHPHDFSKALFQEEYSNQVKDLFRMVSDFRAVNMVTENDSFPLPRIMDLLNMMSGSNRYSTSDIEDAFFNISMRRESRQYTAFTIPNGRFQYTCMLQGAMNAASHWARTINSALEILLPLNVRWYQDDVVNFIYSSLEDHLLAQQATFDALRKNKMILKASKTLLSEDSGSCS